jgi:hypothetical protein
MAPSKIPSRHPGWGIFLPAKPSILGDPNPLRAAQHETGTTGPTGGGRPRGVVTVVEAERVRPDHTRVEVASRSTSVPRPVHRQTYSPMCGSS